MITLMEDDTDDGYDDDDENGKINFIWGKVVQIYSYIFFHKFHHAWICRAKYKFSWLKTKNMVEGWEKSKNPHLDHTHV